MLTTKTVRVTAHWENLSKDPVFREIAEKCELVPRDELKKKRRWEKAVTEDTTSEPNGSALSPEDRRGMSSWNVVEDEDSGKPLGNFPSSDGRPVPINGEHHEYEHQNRYKDATEERLARLGVTGEAKPRVWRGPATAPVEVIPADDIETFDGSSSSKRHPLPSSQEVCKMPPYQNGRKDFHETENRPKLYEYHVSRPLHPPPPSTAVLGEPNHTQTSVKSSNTDGSKSTQEVVPLLQARSLKNQPAHRRSRSRSNSQERRRQADDDTPKQKRRQPQVAAAYRFVVRISKILTLLTSPSRRW